ncbi:hypothetical protein Pmani_034663 [Petrolisthes manimaculis]|uniref:Uncharacterized protein n=1 Tax=Petrolisthes manimaculis TaxID=1843537 RepID=A0AAE1NM30_9EUCA|nr:hypothetical protein Pmani_034663 [Petrolisthes manimaculis]
MTKTLLFLNGQPVLLTSEEANSLIQDNPSLSPGHGSSDGRAEDKALFHSVQDKAGLGGTESLRDTLVPGLVQVKVSCGDGPGFVLSQDDPDPGGIHKILGQQVYPQKSEYGLHVLPSKLQEVEEEEEEDDEDKGFLQLHGAGLQEVDKEEGSLSDNEGANLGSDVFTLTTNTELLHSNVENRASGSDSQGDGSLQNLQNITQLPLISEHLGVDSVASDQSCVIQMPQEQGQVIQMTGEQSQMIQMAAASNQVIQMTTTNEGEVLQVEGVDQNQILQVGGEQQSQSQNLQQTTLVAIIQGEDGTTQTIELTPEETCKLNLSHLLTDTTTTQDTITASMTQMPESSGVCLAVGSSSSDPVKTKTCKETITDCNSGTVLDQATIFPEEQNVQGSGSPVIDDSAGDGDVSLGPFLLIPECNADGTISMLQIRGSDSETTPEPPVSRPTMKAKSLLIKDSQRETAKKVTKKPPLTFPRPGQNIQKIRLPLNQQSPKLSLLKPKKLDLKNVSAKSKDPGSNYLRDIAMRTKFRNLTSFLDNKTGDPDLEETKSTHLEAKHIPKTSVSTSSSIGLQNMTSILSPSTAKSATTPGIFQQMLESGSDLLCSSATVIKKEEQVSLHIHQDPTQILQDSIQIVKDSTSVMQDAPLLNLTTTTSTDTDTEDRPLTIKVKTGPITEGGKSSAVTTTSSASSTAIPSIKCTEYSDGGLRGEGGSGGAADTGSLTSIVYCSPGSDDTPFTVHFPGGDNTKPLGSSENPIQLVQQGNTFQALQPVQARQLEQITTLLQQRRITVPSTTHHDEIYDPKTNMKIVYKVVYPDNLMQADEDEDEADCLKEGEGGGEAGTKDGRVEEKRKGSKKGKDVKKAKAGEEQDIDVEQLDDVESSSQKSTVSVTRSGRISRPPRRMLKDFRHLPPAHFHNQGDHDPPYLDYDHDTTQTHLQHKPPNPVSLEMLPQRKKRSVPKETRLRYTCLTCGKLYMGRIEDHYTKFPDHRRSHHTLPQPQATSSLPSDQSLVQSHPLTSRQTYSAIKTLSTKQDLPKEGEGCEKDKIEASEASTSQSSVEEVVLERVTQALVGVEKEGEEMEKSVAGLEVGMTSKGSGTTDSSAVTSQGMTTSNTDQVIGEGKDRTSTPGKSEEGGEVNKSVLSPTPGTQASEMSGEASLPSETLTTTQVASLTSAPMGGFDIPPEVSKPARGRGRRTGRRGRHGWGRGSRGGRGTGRGRGAAASAAGGTVSVKQPPPPPPPFPNHVDMLNKILNGYEPSEIQSAVGRRLVQNFTPWELLCFQTDRCCQHQNHDCLHVQPGEEGVPQTVCNNINTLDVWKKRLRTLESLVKECQEEFKKVMQPASQGGERKANSDALSREVKWGNVRREAGGHITPLGMAETVHNISSQGTVTNQNAAIDGDVRTACGECNRTMSLGNDPSHNNLPPGHMTLAPTQSHIALETEQHTHRIVTIESEESKPGHHLNANSCIGQQVEHSHNNTKEGHSKETPTVTDNKSRDRGIMSPTDTQATNSQPDNVGPSGSISSGNGVASSHDGGVVEVSELVARLLGVSQGIYNQRQNYQRTSSPIPGPFSPQPHPSTQDTRGGGTDLRHESTSAISLPQMKRPLDEDECARDSISPKRFQTDNKLEGVDTCVDTIVNQSILGGSVRQVLGNVVVQSGSRGEDVHITGLAMDTTVFPDSKNSEESDSVGKILEQATRSLVLPSSYNNLQTQMSSEPSLTPSQLPSPIPSTTSLISDGAHPKMHTTGPSVSPFTLPTLETEGLMTHTTTLTTTATHVLPCLTSGGPSTATANISTTNLPHFSTHDNTGMPSVDSIISSCNSGGLSCNTTGIITCNSGITTCLPSLNSGSISSGTTEIPPNNSNISSCGSVMSSCIPLSNMDTSIISTSTMSQVNTMPLGDLDITAEDLPRLLSEGTGMVVGAGGDSRDTCDAPKLLDSSGDTTDLSEMLFKLQEATVGITQNHHQDGNLSHTDYQGQMMAPQGPGHHHHHHQHHHLLTSQPHTQGLVEHHNLNPHPSPSLDTSQSSVGPSMPLLTFSGALDSSSNDFPCVSSVITQPLSSGDEGSNKLGPGMLGQGGDQGHRDTITPETPTSQLNFSTVSGLTSSEFEELLKR